MLSTALKRTGLRWIVVLVSTLLFSEHTRAAESRGMGILDFQTEVSARRWTSVPRMVLAFYYTWYGRPETHGRWFHWEDVEPDQHEIASSTQYPERGAYDSHDADVIDYHIDLAKESGIDAFICTWWGPGDFTDRAFPKVLDSAHKKGFCATVYWETVPGSGEARVSRAVSDLVYILRRYGSHRAFLRLDGKPVIFVYGRVMGQVAMEEWPEIITRAREGYGGDFILIADGYRESFARMFDGVHTYIIAGALRGKTAQQMAAWSRTSFANAVNLAKRRARISCVTVIPGYDDRKIRHPGLHVDRLEGETYRVLWEEAIRADPDWILITSWNEWHEGSEIEPSWEHGRKYVGVTAQYARQFKRTPHSSVAIPESALDTSPERVRKLQELYEGVTIGVLPGFDSPAVFWLADAGLNLRELKWSEVRDAELFSAGNFPVVVYGAGEQYVQTVKEKGDVDAGLVRFLHEGGLLIALGSGPFPFYYNEKEEMVNQARSFGFPICGSGVAGSDRVRGWETPPAGVKLTFRIDTRRMPGFPGSVPYPDWGDLRWRPCTSAGLDEGDVYMPLVRLTDEGGHNYGDAVVYIEHRESEPQNGKNIYAWMRMMDVVDRGSFLSALFRLAIERIDRPESSNSRSVP